MPERELKEISFVFSDLHLGEGKPNNLEYFKADKEFVSAINIILQKYSTKPIHLRLLGDTFDFLAVEFNGRTLAEVDEWPAIQKIELICNAHKQVLSAMGRFLKFGKITFYIGNHDQPLAWPNVKNFIRRALVQDMEHKDQINAWKRIRFVISDKKNKVLFIHGNDVDPANKTPKQIFLQTKDKNNLPKRLLNIPYGSHLVTDLVNRLATDSKFCKGNFWIGRVEPHWYVWLEAVVKNWWFAFYASFLWFITPFRHRFSRRWWVRKKSGFLWMLRHNLNTTLATIFNKISGREFTQYPKEILKNNDDIDIVISGHDHSFHFQTTPNGTSVNPGGWCELYKAEFQKPKLVWKRFKQLEKICKYAFSAFKMFRKKTRQNFLPKKCEIYGIAFCKFYSDGYKEVKLMRFNKEKNCLEKLN